jgi:uncharacterized membrane protein YqjE
VEASVSTPNTPRYEGPDTVTSIPLTSVDPATPRDASIGQLVKEATTQVSTLVRSEVALAKAEVTAEIKKGVTGSIFFLIALTILLFSAFFFFFFVVALLAVWLPTWAAFLIVFAVMLLAAALFAFMGWRKVRKVRAPKKTIESLKEAKTVLPGQHEPPQDSKGYLVG